MSERSQSSLRGALFDGYCPPPGTRDELFAPEGDPRADVRRVIDLFETLGLNEFRRRQRLADEAFRRGGITFSVYSDQRGVEKTFPFDTIPRVLPASEWAGIERGLIQRVAALNAFLADVYGDQRILREGIVPRELVETSQSWLPQAKGVRPPGGTYVHVAGIDLIRAADGSFLVLEDNARVPSGVSYVLENRAVLKRVFPRVFSEARVRRVDDYPGRLRSALISCSPVAAEETRLVVLTPGPFNSAYFEHSYLARRMGCSLVEGGDLFVRDDQVFVKTTHGAKPVHVIYRRIDDDFLDPRAFRKDSLVGVPGLFDAYRAGRVTLANALGNGIADDKAMYALVPDMIRFYLSEEPLLGQVPTWLCHREDDLRYVLEHLSELVVKEVDGSGGYGMLMGPSATRSEIKAYAERIKAEPRGFVAQPLIELSTCPSYAGRSIAARRVDLRPYVVTGDHTWVMPGGLTRVALAEGSYVVNSSQGGGSKDTWVLKDEVEA
ncbi:circularly permuted type 2 ATP-grasp protein [Engelhardtia mirabilis]|uniref:Circularly permuted ATP-grasp type 2 domain-containing protein n=1 Tax=Engelhardtia mirabilis TaxID=2528011 RepID=A0A518BGM3_9BACT|nr:hypothetical protein Pla133_12050 [Planctomycetes bacterium Pla133]QDV00466.1 hypothetical protein Pla86_12050 [Planctomycetes bacterium Pla86]